MGRATGAMTVVEADQVCQVARVGLGRLTCDARESGGYRCEVVGPHTRHAVGEHTIEHERRGNGWLCSFRGIFVIGDWLPS